MTIKELCMKYIYCKKCPFNDACDLLDCIAPDENDNDDVNKAITKSIIETAKLLQEQEPKTGQWLWTDEINDVSDLPYYKCSNCKLISLENGNYCPFCGARMT